MKDEIKKDLKKILLLLLALLIIVLITMYFDGKRILNEGSEFNIKNIDLSYELISADELNKILDKDDKDKIFLLNVDVKDASKIIKTDRSIPYINIIKRESDLPKDKGIRMVVYSEDENMGKIAAQKLKIIGYTDVSNLQGGTALWEKNKLPTINQ